MEQGRDEGGGGKATRWLWWRSAPSHYNPNFENFQKITIKMQLPPAIATNQRPALPSKYQPSDPQLSPPRSHVFPVFHQPSLADTVMQTSLPRSPSVS